MRSSKDQSRKPAFTRFRERITPERSAANSPQASAFGVYLVKSVPFWLRSARSAGRTSAGAWDVGLSGKAFKEAA